MPTLLVVDDEPAILHAFRRAFRGDALDVLPQGGHVRVEVRGPTPDKPAVTVQVQDDGPGIAADMNGRLFEPFASTKETGLGLGLSICRRLVESHGGAIHGADAPEGGALFAFTLPISS